VDNSDVFSDTLLDHFRNPRNVGELPPPAITVEVSNPACGDILRLSARLEDGRVVESRYRVRGCTASIAAGSALTDMITGQTRESLAALSPNDIEEHLDGLPSASKHAAALCGDGVKALLAALSGRL
jgi:nitrogen fixation NifU-like protein